MQTLDLDYNNRTGALEGKLDLENGRTLTVRIEQDTDPMDSPREWGSLGTMACWHRRYNLGDEHDYTADDFFSELACEVDPTVADRLYYWEDGDGSCRQDAENRARALVEKAIDQNVVILPLYLYDHSGLTMSTGPFSCPWDSGQVGWIFCTKDDIRREWGVRRVSKKLLKWAEDRLRAEVEVYDQYLRGEIYGYTLEISHPETCEHCHNTETVEDFEDSCWGFYGDPSDYMIPDVINPMLADYGVQVSA